MANRYWVGGSGSYNNTANWSATSGGASGASVPSVSDDVFFNAASGASTVTITSGALCLSLNLTGFIGSFVFTFNLSTVGASINLGLGLYSISGAAALRFQNPTTITSNGSTWGGNILFASNGVHTLVDDFTVSGTVTIASSVSPTINGSLLNLLSNLTHTGTGTVSGTSTIQLLGTGTWSHTATGAITNNIVINTAGTITIGTVYKNGGTLTYTLGTVVTTGSTLNIGAATTLNTNGIIWNNITATGVMTLGSNLTLTGTLSTGATGTLSFTLGGFNLISTNANLTLNAANFTMPANQTFKTLTVSNNVAINGNTLTITENLTIDNFLSGTTSIIYAGTGTWSNTSGTLSNILTINTAGILTISGTVYKVSGLFTYTAGTIIDTTGTVVVGSLTLNISGFTFRKLLVNSGIILTSNLNATTFGTWGTNTINFSLAGNTLNFTHLELGSSVTLNVPTAWVCQNIEFVNTGSGGINGNSITINGNILQSGSGSYAGTTPFIYAGTGTWDATSIIGYFSNSFTINTAGTLTFINGNIGGGIFTYTAGTVITTGSTLNIRQSGTTMNDGGIVWYNVVTPTNVSTLILNSQLVCSNALTIDNSQVTFSGTDGTFDVYYLNLNSSGTVARNPRLVSTKTYRVRAGFTSQGTLAFPITLSAVTVGSQAIFTVDPGATIDVGFVNATDINSSLGKKIYSYKGVFSNTLNWGLLPIDVKSGSSTFVN